MSEVSTFRLYLMRATYLFLVVGLGLTIWPGIIHHGKTELTDGVVSALLGTVAVLAAFGLRYPLQMLPVLLFELIWKIIWLLAFALPLYLAHQIDANTQATIYDCALVVIFPIAIPWPYFFAHYVKKAGDRWR